MIISPSICSCLLPEAGNPPLVVKQLLEGGGTVLTGGVAPGPNILPQVIELLPSVELLGGEQVEAACPAGGKHLGLPVMGVRPKRGWPAASGLCSQVLRSQRAATTWAEASPASLVAATNSRALWMSTSGQVWSLHQASSATMPGRRVHPRSNSPTAFPGEQNISLPTLTHWPPTWQGRGQPGPPSGRGSQEGR